jgi:hypothetical protein
MKQINIHIDDKTYPIRFGYGAIRLLGEAWNLKGYAQVIEKVGGLVPQDGETADMLHFDTLESLAEVIHAGIANAGDYDQGLDIDRKNIIDAFFEDMDILVKVFELFMASMPQQKRPVEPPKKKRTAKTARSS